MKLAVFLGKYCTVTAGQQNVGEDFCEEAGK